MSDNRHGTVNPGSTQRFSSGFGAVAPHAPSVDHDAVDDLLIRYFETLEEISSDRRWFQSVTALRFAALHLTVGDTRVGPGEIADMSSALLRPLDRIDPLRAFAVPMAGLAGALDRSPALAAEALGHAIARFASASRRLGRTDRARAVPILAFAPIVVKPENSVERVQDIHQAWNTRHRWMTTGRHYSFASMAVVAGLDGDESANAAAAVHDLLGDAGYWHEWDASILLSFSPEGPFDASSRYLAAVSGFTEGSRKPSPAARDDLAVVSLANGDPTKAGEKLAEYNRKLLSSAPRPSRQTALALSAALVLAGGSRPDGWQRVIVDGFGLYAYAEALREEAPD